MSQILLLAVCLAYVGIRFRIGVLKVRARHEGDVEREARLAALGFQMMIGGAVLILALAIGVAVTHT